MNNTNLILSDESEKRKNRELFEEYFSHSLEVDLLLRLYPDDKDTPVVSNMKKIVQKTVALSFFSPPQWALAVWDMDTATLYMVKYDRSH